jgi:hypothetical protein
MAAPNQPIPVAEGPFRLRGTGEGSLESDLVFRWIPSIGVEFDGTCSLPRVELGSGWTLSSDDPGFEVPVAVTGTTILDTPTQVRGRILQPLRMGNGPMQVLRFSLANFPEFNGDRVSYVEGESRGVTSARLQCTASAGTCRVDRILESDDLRKATKGDPGFVLSHVGEWLPSSGQMAAAEAEDTLEMLHFWFGLLRGAWSGPLFPQGLDDGEVIWRSYAAWNLEDPRAVTTWMPEHQPLDLSALFAGFLGRWADPAWRDPLRMSIAWFVDANAPAEGPESRVILAQVALELLAQVHLLETQGRYTRKAFKAMSAAKRIRLLLDDVGIPLGIPDYMTHLPSLREGDAQDGPGVMTLIRNGLVHQEQHQRTRIRALDGSTWYECTQLALQYVELVLLALCGYNGHYARRAWKGWKGDDETPVPWNVSSQRRVCQ